MNKTLKKLAIIRSNDDLRCPFGLNISQDCKTVGELIHKMQPIPESASNETRTQIAEQNKELLENSLEEAARCPFASKLFPNKPHFVDCDFGDTAAGLSHDVSFVGSPYYSQIFNGIGMGGLYNYPLTYQTDGQEYRNMYYGMYGWASNRLERCLKRQAILKKLVKSR